MCDNLNPIPLKNPQSRTRQVCIGGPLRIAAGAGIAVTLLISQGAGPAAAPVEVAQAAPLAGGIRSPDPKWAPPFQPTTQPTTQPATTMPATTEPTPEDPVPFKGKMATPRANWQVNKAPTQS